MMIKILPIFVLFFFIQPLKAQNNDHLNELKLSIEKLIDQKKWQEAKNRIDIFYNNYPVAPTELDLIEKYEVDKLNRRVTSVIEQEEKTYQRIESYNLVEDYRNYLSNYPYGKYKDQVTQLLRNSTEESDWNTAKIANNTAAYSVYLEKHPEGKYADYARQTISSWDKSAFENARVENTIRSMNYYLNTYPNGKYRSDAKAKLKELEEDEVYQKANKSGIITDYENYIAKYPNGKYVTIVNNLIENSYYKFGNDYFSKKQWSLAKAYYETYLLKFPNGVNSASARNRIRTCQNRMNQTGAGFWIYSYEKESPYGTSFGNINPNSLGFYFNFKFDKNIFTGEDVLYTIDNNGNSDSPWNILTTGETHSANISLSGGITFKILYPLWGYVGGGVGYYPVYEAVNEYSSTWIFYDLTLMRNTDLTEFRAFPEFGLKLKVANILLLKYGMVYNKRHFINQFGIGFQI